MDFQDLLVAHTQSDRSTAIETFRIDHDLSSRKEPAHGQRLHPSLAVPLLHAVDVDQVVSRNVAERRPRLDVIGVVSEPAARDRS